MATKSQRGRTLVIELTDEEHQVLQRLANEHGMVLIAYVHWLITTVGERQGVHLKGKAR